MSTNTGRLDGKIAIVTGAGSRGDILGNGQATAILFAQQGAKVMLVDSNQENLDRTKDHIAMEGGECLTFVGDVTESLTCKEIVKNTIDAYGALDILHNNVGIGGAGTIAVSYTHLRAHETLRYPRPRDATLSRMPSSA